MRPMTALMDFFPPSAGIAPARTIHPIIALMDYAPPSAGIAEAITIRPMTALMDYSPLNVGTAAAKTIHRMIAPRGCSQLHTATTIPAMTSVIPQPIATPAFHPTSRVIPRMPAAVLRRAVVAASQFSLLSSWWCSFSLASAMTPTSRRALLLQLRGQHPGQVTPTHQRRDQKNPLGNVPAPRKPPAWSKPIMRLMRFIRSS